VSRNHQAKVAQRLQAQGFVETFRGRSGGMRLARPAEDIVVGDVVRRFENLDSFVGCFVSGGGCAVSASCALKPALNGALGAFLAHLDGFRLSDLVANRPAFAERLEALAAA
jgi:Rrf2 family nitric oxide-sensitive transcriptional repressor